MDEQAIRCLREQCSEIQNKSSGISAHEFGCDKGMRITLVISHIGSGGADRVMSVMANYWAEHGREVTLVTLSSAVDWYGLHSSVKRVRLNLRSASGHIGRAVRNNWQRMKCLRQELRNSRPDVVIAFGDTTNVLTLIASWGLGIPVIVSERVDARQHSIGWIWERLRYAVYRRADGLVVQSHAVRDWARKLVRPGGVHVIPNPVEPPVNGVDRAAKEPAIGPTAVSMGRLTEQKGFDLLLRAFAKCANKHAVWSLVILGEGDERASLEALVAELGLKDRVTLPGRTQNPTRILQGADLFVMSSRYEGFPNALLEAMAAGLAVISTDCPSGPREIIRDGVDGVLVAPHDINALASAMDCLMADRAERERLGAYAVEVLERFSIKKIMKMWDDLLTDTCRVGNT